MTDSMRDRIDSTMDKGTGQGKEALGKITDQGDLEREGQTDQAQGEVTDRLERVMDFRVAGARGCDA